MIKANEIIKNYGSFKALKGISFQALNNKITALLGPNGAGKTTTLRVLSGYLTPDSGIIEYFGNASLDLKELKKIIGYVPENNPVYEDIYVSDYLEWIAKLYSLGEKDIKSAIEKCALYDVIDKKIGSLSKGYKQRVSLAKAIIFKPKILLLDEPTTGLDPNQANETRELIKELKEDRVVIISTHILSEAENLCDEIIIINKGEIAISGAKDDIVKKYSKNSYTLKFEGNIESNIFNFENLSNISSRTENGETLFNIEFSDETDMRKEILRFAKEKNISLIEFYRNRITLEEIFAKITRHNGGL